MSKRIDSIDESIIGNVSSFRIHKRISPVLNAQTSYSGNNALKYANKLISGTIVSSAFFYEVNDVIFLVYMKDRLTSSSTSTISLYDAYNDTVIEADVATVNYTTGIIDIPALTVAGYFLNSSDIKIYSKIDELDIQSSRDLILLTDESTLNTQLKQYAGLVINVVNA